MRRLLLAMASMAGSLSAATLTVEVEHTVAGEPLRFERAQRLPDERLLTLTRLDYLITEFALLTPDGRALRPPRQAAFVSAGQGRTSFTLADVPLGEFAGVAFRVGVGGELAAVDAASWPAGHPLNPAVNGLHWGWQDGYVFLALEGRVGSRSFSYHLARPEQLMTVRLERPFAIRGDATVRLRMAPGSLLEGLMIGEGSRDDSTHSAFGDTLATLLKDRVQKAWTFQSVREEALPVAHSTATALPPGTTAYILPIPLGFPAPELPADNPLTVEGVALGARLFHETQLSVNGRQSCASCHQPEYQFAERRAVSLGALQQAGTRNAPALQNLAWHSRFTWDGHREKLREAALAPISDEREMALPIGQAVARLAQSADYRTQFARAFGGPAEQAVTEARIGLALEQFLLTKTAASSKFDRVLAGNAQLTEEEARGFALFHTEHDPVRGKRGADCFHCHGGFDFSDRAFHDTGLGGVDEGMGKVTQRAAHRGKFKTPSLRNLPRTAPYFHDGRAATLEEALAHYDRGFQRTANLDPNLAKRGALELTREEKSALIAFLKTLADD